MSWSVRREAGRTIVKIVLPLCVAAPAACGGGDPAPEPPAVVLPSRYRDAGGDRSVVLEPADTGPIDTGPPPDPLCTEPGLVLCYTFDEAIENLAATTPKLVPSKVLGIELALGKKNKAARLDTGSVVSFDYAPLLEVQTASVEAWINRDLATFGEDTVFDDDQRFAMTVEADGTLRCNTTTGAARGGKIGVETWAHVACTFDGSTIKAYVNGVEIASAAGTLGVSATAGAAIGDGSPNGGEGFAGEIDSFRVFNLVRTPAQISAAARN